MRGTGTTTQQMLAAPKGSHFVWVNAQLSYPKHLARKLGRDDLIIVPPSFLSNGAYRGMELAGLVIDHAAEVHPCDFEEALYRVREETVRYGK